MIPYDEAVKLGIALGKAIIGLAKDAETRRHMLAVAHQQADSTVRFHVLAAAKHKAKRKAARG